MNRAVEKLDQLLATQQTELVEAIVAEQYTRQPDLTRRYGDKGRTRCREDVAYHLAYLNQAITFGSPTLFADYIAWVQAMLAQRGIPTHDLETNLQILNSAVRDRLPSEAHNGINECIEGALEQLSVGPATISSFVESQGPLVVLAQQYLASLLRLERKTALRQISEAVRSGSSIRDIYLSVFQPVQYEIGRLWQLNKISVAQEHYCTAATQLIMSQLYPYILSEEHTKAIVVVTCIGSELHELGAWMVADFFELEGWHSIYLAANTPSSAILRLLEEQQADLLCLSATMSYHLGLVSDLIALIRSSESLQDIKILVGGYPFRLVPDLWLKIGADGYGIDAGDAVAVAKQLLSIRD